MPRTGSSSVKDERVYEALREQGASTEKAARTANAQAAGGVDHDTRRYEDRSKDELYDLARRLGVPGRSRMTKDELIDALRRR